LRGGKADFAFQKRQKSASGTRSSSLKASLATKQSKTRALERGKQGCDKTIFAMPRYNWV